MKSINKKILKYFLIVSIILVPSSVLLIMNVDSSNIAMLSTGLKWQVFRATEQESNLTFWTLDEGTKKTELGWIPKSGSCAGWADKLLYHQNGTLILDDKDKEITVKCESSKCDGANCYHISLTEAEAVDIDNFVKLGENSIVTVYQDINLVNYELGFASANVTLACDDVPQNDIFIFENPDNYKFGANGSFTGLRNCTYKVKSTQQMIADGIKPYIRDPVIKHNYLYSNYEDHVFDFSDVCNKIYGSTNISADCFFNYYSEFLRNVTDNETNITTSIYDYFLEVGFISNNSIDPTITITAADIAATSLLNNVILETGDANFTHLAIDDESDVYLEFDGAGDYVDIGEFDVLEGISEFSASFWAKWDGVLIGGNEMPLTKAGSGTDTFLFFYTGGEDMGFLVSTSGGTAVADTTLNLDNNWGHFVGVYNGTNVLIYRDGVLQADQPALTGTTSVTAHNLYVGSDTDGGNDWNGSIDEVRIYNTSLNSSQITEIFNSGRTPNTSLPSVNLTGWWQMEQGVGVSADDSAGGNDGTLVGDTSWSTWGLGDNLVGYWNFDGDNVNTEGATSYDWTKEGNDGALVGDAVVNSSGGLFGNGLVLDGVDDYVSVPGFTGDEGVAELSVSFWVKVPGSPSGTQRIISHYQGSGDNVFRFDFESDNDLFFIVRNSVGGGNDAAFRGSSIEDGEWHHIVGRYNGSFVSIWMDGVQAAEIGALTGVTDAANQALTFGVLEAASSDFEGSIDEIMIFNTSLTDQEILDIYNNASARFKPTGTQKVRAVKVTDGSSWDGGGSDRVNLLATVEEDMGSRIEARVGMINLSVNSSGLVYYAPFEWGSAVDISGEGNDGTIVNAVFNLSGGLNESGGFLFDGDGDYINVGSDTSLNALNFTISMWFNFVSDGLDDTLINKRESGEGNLHTNYYCFINDDSTDGIVCVFGNTTNTVSILSNTGITPNEWTHFIYSFNGTEAFMYVNGVKQNDIDTPGFIPHIGGTQITLISDSVKDFNGSIDEVLIFNRSLSATEIANLYGNQSGKFNVPYYTGYQNFSSGVNVTFEVSTEADFVFGDYKFFAGDSSSAFYSSVFGEGVLEVASYDAPVLSLYSPSNGSYYNSSSVLFNASSTVEGSGSIVGSIDGSLVSWWRMDEVNATHVLDYVGANDGLVVDDAVQVDDGKFGAGFSFDGDGDYVSIPDNSLLDVVDNFSVSLWVKNRKSAIIDTGTELMMAKSGSGADVFSISWGQTEDIICSTTDDDDATIIAKSAVFTDGIPDGSGDTWNHVVCVRNSTHIAAYVNAVVGGTVTAVNGLTRDSASPITIGDDFNGGSNTGWNGSIDDVMIWNRSLSAEEISSLYNATALAHTETLVDGAHSFRAYTQDLAGNVDASGVIGFNVDTSAPTLSLVTPVNNSYYNSSSVLFNVSSSEVGSGSIVSDIDNSLVSWWRMDDVNGSGYVMDYVGSNDGLPVADAVQTDAGKFGKGFSFDGDGDYVSVSDTSSFNVDGGYLTVSYWHKPTNSVTDDHSVFMFYTTTGSTETAYIRNNGEYWRLGGSIYDNTVLSSLSVTLNAADYLVADVWVNIVFVYNFTDAVNTNLTIYKDGVLIGSAQAAVSSTPFTSLSLDIGRAVGAGFSDSNGTIDDVMIWNRSLSAEEILSLYNATALGHTETLNDGAHTFSAYTQDLAGNIDTSGIIGFNVDTVNPTLTLTSPLNNTYFNSSSVLFNVSSSEVGSGSIVADIDNSLVSWWRMDDVNGSGYVTDYVGSNDGVAVGDAVRTDAGKFGKGFSFDGLDGGDYILIDDNGDSFGKTVCINGCTFSLWANKADETNYGALLGRSDSSFPDDTYFNFYITNGENMVFLMYDQSNGVSCIVDYSGGDISQDVWYHYITVYDNSTGTGNLSLYRDGVHLESTTCGFSGINATDWANDEDVFIGTVDDTSISWEWNGSIDDVMIWNRSLSAEEILSLYNATALEHVEVLGDGAHTFSAWTQDLAGNLDYSGLINFNVTTAADSTYPSFSAFASNNNTNSSSNLGFVLNTPAGNNNISQFTLNEISVTTTCNVDTLFANITADIADTNGTAFVTLDGTEYPMSNLTNEFNVTIPIATVGNYVYNFSAYGSGTNNNLNTSDTFTFLFNTTCGEVDVSFDPESTYSLTTGYGYTGDEGLDSSWDAIHDGAGSFSSNNDSATTFNVEEDNDFVFYAIRRLFLPFNTTDLPDNAIIDSAKFIHISNLIMVDAEGNDGLDYIQLVGETTQASNTTLVDADYVDCSTVDNPTLVSNTQDVSDIQTGEGNIYTLDLNGIGLDLINKEGVTLFGLREGHDIEDTPMPNSGRTFMRFTNLKLNVTYSIPPPTKSGLINITQGAIPFYTNSSTNPITTSYLHQGESETTTLWFNASGEVSLTTAHIFFVFVNSTRNQSLNNITSTWEVYINQTQDAGPVDSCTYIEGSGDWVVTDVCQITNEVINVCPSSINISDTGSLNISGTSIINASTIYWYPKDVTYTYRARWYTPSKLRWGIC